MKVIRAILALYAPGLTLANVQLAWKFASAPSDGLQNVTFGFNVAKAPHAAGFFFAQQFSFIGLPSQGYTGVQPRSDANGKSVVHGVFSSFQAGTKTTHSNCFQGADGGPGVSCAVEVNGDYSHKWNLVVENKGSATWRGTMVDASTGHSTVVGEWTLPSGGGNIQNGMTGFVEYYPWNTQPSHSCGSLPKAEVTFDDPTSKTGGASGGTIDKPFEYGDCNGQFALSANRVSNGWNLTFGYGQLPSMHSAPNAATSSLAASDTGMSTLLPEGTITSASSLTTSTGDPSSGDNGGNGNDTDNGGTNSSGAVSTSTAGAAPHETGRRMVALAAAGLAVAML